ncbi:MAG: DNA translocase FtsK [Lachnospiraceae bacterium]|nr:DNA translocase FtsK [Lachnospiraceae bacterium]
MGERDYLLPVRMSGSIGLFLILGIFSDLLSGNAAGLDTYNAGELYRLSAEGRNGGGVIAGSLSFAMIKNIGKAGCVIICLLVLIICLFAINKTFFAELFKNIILNAGDRSGELIQNSRQRRAERRLRLEQEEEPLALPDKSNDEYVDEETGEIVPSTALTVTEKMRKERSGKKEVFESVSGSFENWKNNVKKRSEDGRIRKEAEKKEKEETQDAKELLRTTKAPVHGEQFREKHTGEMHELSYSEYEDDHTDEPAADDASGTWYDPVKRPGPSSDSFDDKYDETPEDDDLGFERVPVKSDHRINLTNEFDKYDTAPLPLTEPAVSPEVKAPEKPVAPSPAPRASIKSEEPPAPKKPLGKFNYKAPGLDALKKGSGSGKGSANEVKDVQTKLIETLSSFGIEAEMGNYSKGPTVTRYELTVNQGTKLSKVVGLSDEIKMALAATDIRIEAPIPGKSAIGIEVPNITAEPVLLGDLLSSKEFKDSKASLSFAVGKDIEGKTVVANIADFPHVLIAGTTGSGKSVCINTLILSLLYKSSPENVQLMLVDPKVVELKVYNGIPHLPFDVVTKPKAASEMLKWAVSEMERRYRLFADREVRDIEGYNTYVEDVNAGRREPVPADTYEESDSLTPALRKLPRIVIIIDELADLMMVAAKEVEESIVRLAQLARACGMHLVVATQRPSVDVITGLIKANMPSRVAFAVSSGVDSRTILDTVGAEKLLGKGDMLFYPKGKMKPERLQGAFVSDKEVTDVTYRLRNEYRNSAFRNPLDGVDGIDDLKKRIIDIENGVDPSVSSSASSASSSSGNSVFGDELFVEAGKYIIRSGKASIDHLQRVLKIGFNRAARIMDELADNGVVGQEQGTKPRDILMTEEMFDAYVARKSGGDE